MADSPKQHASISSQKQRRKDYLFGIILLLVVVLLWTVASFVIQDALDNGFHKLFWTTYLNSSSFILYLIPYATKHLLRKCGFRVWGVTSTTSHENYQLLSAEGQDEFITRHVPFTTKETAKLAATFAFPYFAMNWAFVASLSYTSVASCTILSGTVGFFTLIFSRIFRVESLTTMKIVAVTTSFVGIAIVSLSDSSNTNEAVSPSPDVHRAPIWGDFLAVVSALVGAFYMVLFKYRSKDDSRLDMRLMFGFLGLFIFLLGWPIGVLLHLFDLERFAFPDSKRVILALLTGMGVTFCGDILYLTAVMKTTPLVASVGQSLTMPLAVIGDFLLHGTASFLAILGCIVVLVSFGVLGMEDSGKETKQDLISGKPLDDRESEGEEIEMGIGLHRLD